MNFTDKEKAVLTLFLHEKYSLKRALLHYWPYLVPILFIAIYGFIKQEYIALTIAFTLLLLMIFWYIVHAEVYWEILQSILQKFNKELSDKAKQDKRVNNDPREFT